MSAIAPGAKLIRVSDGQKITTPGLYDLSLRWYHDDCCVGPSASSSVLRTVWSDSPAHAWAQSRLNPANWEERQDQETGEITRVFLPEEGVERPHFSLGRAAHHLLFLGRKGFDKEFAVRPEKWSDWRTNDSKRWKREMIDAGYTIITDNELEA